MRDVPEYRKLTASTHPLYVTSSRKTRLKEMQTVFSRNFLVPIFIVIDCLKFETVQQWRKVFSTDGHM